MIDIYKNQDIMYLSTEEIGVQMIRTDSYVTTIFPDTEGDMELRIIRNTVSKINKKLKADGSPKRFRVSIRGRLGEYNPYARHYRRGGKYWRWSSVDIRPEHANRFDIYIHPYYNY